MDLQKRIGLMARLGNYMLSSAPEWIAAKEKAYLQNNWFIPNFIELATKNLATEFLEEATLQEWVKPYNFPTTQHQPKTVGIVMAGNIPLVGFHDFLAVFISGHEQMIKLSSSDEVLLKHLVAKLTEWEPYVADFVGFSEMLKGCDAYIATGSNNTSRYFQYYFDKYPNIIRKNRTSVAVLDGSETSGQLEKLADDVYLFFGRGCRNVTKLYVPRGYDFVPMFDVFNKYNYLAEHYKYKNNYDYQLALLILNKQYYMTNGSILLTEAVSLFTPISRLNYEYYDSKPTVFEKDSLQCMVGSGHVPFGQAQQPGLCDFADGIDVLQFLRTSL